MSSAFLYVVLFGAAANADWSCVYLLHGDGEPPWHSAAMPLRTVENHGASSSPGKFGTAIRFDGDSAYLDGGTFYGRGLSFPRQTISLWIRPERDGQAEGILGSQDEPEQSSWRWTLVREADRTIAFRIYDNAQRESPRREARSQTPAPANVWTHVAVVIDTGVQTATLYLNGKQVASDRVLSNSPYGTLIVGHSLGGPYRGSVDELAVFERALRPVEITGLAQRESPLPDAVPRDWEGFWLRPQGDTPYLGIRHSDLPDSLFLLRVTEYAYFDHELQRNVSAHDVSWEVGPDRKTASFRWDAPQELKHKVGLDFWGEYAANGDHLDFSITGKNVGAEDWDRSRLSLVCLISGGASPFIDYEAQRTFIHRGSDFVTMNEVIGGEFAPHRMCGVSVRRDGKQPVSRLAAKVSLTGDRVLGLAVDRAGSLSFNFQKRTSCIHSNPAWPLLKPGQEATAHGRMYLIKGSLEDLWKRYRDDFELAKP